jgi:hypothetical protein
MPVGRARLAAAARRDQTGAMNKQQIFTISGGMILFGGLLFGGPPAKAQEAPIAGSAAAAPTGDDALSCEQLTAEATALHAELEGMTREISQAASSQIRAARSAQAASTASSIVSSLAGNIPIIGGLIGSVGARVATAGVEAQQDKLLELSERMMTRGSEVGSRLQRVESLRAARCGTGQGGAAAEE